MATRIEKTDLARDALYDKVNTMIDEVNTKIDKSTISGWSMPSSRYIDLTLGADGTTYVAPANGYFYVKKNSTSGQYIWFRLYNSTNTVMDITFWGSNNGFIGAFIPVSKGSKVEIYYSASGDTQLFRFIYAEGEPYNPIGRNSGI